VTEIRTSSFAEFTRQVAEARADGWDVVIGGDCQGDYVALMEPPRETTR
jgi:hypothetical protein